MFRIQGASLFLMLPICASAASQATVEFDHKGKSELAQKVQLDPGDALTVRILNTCKAKFTYAYRGYVKSEPSEPPESPESKGFQASACTIDNAPKEDELKQYFKSQLALKGACETGEVMLVIPHDEQYGGYIVEARKNADVGTVRALEPKESETLFSAFAKLFKEKASKNEKQLSCDNLQSEALNESLTSSRLETTLENASFLVVVEDRSWRYGIAGGFIASSLVDRKFALVDDPESTADPPSQMVVRRQNAEDDVSLGVSAMIHLYNPQLSSRLLRNIAWTFGLGVGDANEVSYFGGISYRFSDQAYLTIGVNAASVDRLPPEQALNAPPTSDNVLSNLGSKTEIGAFIGISYAFLNPGMSPFKKISQPDGSTN